MMGCHQGPGQEEDQGQSGGDSFDLATNGKHKLMNQYSTCFIFVNFHNTTPIAITPKAILQTRPPRDRFLESGFLKCLLLFPYDWEL